MFSMRAWRALADRRFVGTGRDMASKRQYLKCDGEFEEIAFGKAAATTATSCALDVWHDDVFFAQVDQTMLRDPECLRCLGEGQPRH